MVLHERDLEITACRSSGAGGQNVNKVNSAVQIKHRPTGVIVRCEAARSQGQNKVDALALLRAKLWEAKQSAATGARADERRRQVGGGARGDKRRTAREQDGQVNDHLTGRRWRLEDYERGLWS